MYVLVVLSKKGDEAKLCFDAHALIQQHPLPHRLITGTADVTPPTPLQSSQAISDADASASTLIRTACTLLATRYTNVDEAVFGVGGVATQRRQWLPLKVPVTNSQTISDYLAAILQQAIDMVSYAHISLD